MLQFTIVILTRTSQKRIISVFSHEGHKKLDRLIVGAIVFSYGYFMQKNNFPARTSPMKSERRWQRLDRCQFKTIVVSQVPRVQCSEHGTQTVQVPWAEKQGRFTKHFERFAIAVLQACSTPAAMAT